MAERIGRAHAFGHPTLGERDGIGHGIAVRQRARGRRRERVTRTVVMAGIDAGRVELVEFVPSNSRSGLCATSAGARP